MKKITLSMVAALGLAGACGGQMDPAEVSTDTAELHVGPSNKVAALVTQSNLVSDQMGVATVTNPDLVNAWGLSFNPAGIAWVSAAEKGLSLIIRSDGSSRPPVVIPPPKNGQPPAAPTGQAFNPNASDFKGDVFIFVTEDGTISGWQPSFGTNAMLRVDRSKRSASYKGMAIADDHGKRRLFAADFHNNRIDIFDDDYHPIHHEKLVDRRLPDGFAPFNIFAHDGKLFVSYAKQDDPADAHDDLAGPGNGFVDVFEPDGDFVERLISHGALNSPWGMAIMPADKKHDSERLLVGNFGDGRINVYELERRDHKGRHAEFEGALGDKPHHPLVIDGLWALVFGPGAGGFDADDLYFTAGPGGEEHGLFGEIGFVE